jgi:hypothetical protein
MTTHEREITAPVDLCLPDGSALNPAARGWSRVPLHRANLHGHHGRNKRWDYWCVLSGDLVVSWVYSNVDHLGLADVWWCDLPTGTTGGAGTGSRGGAGFDLPEVPGTAPLQIDQHGFALAITDDDAGTRIEAAWTERDGRPGTLEVDVALPPGHESVNVVIPWSDDEFNFTSKHQARPATGELVVGDDRRAIGPDAWGVLDVGRGRWPEHTTWNWGGGAGRAGAHVVGLQIGAKWTAGTGHTENGLIVDGRVSKIGRELEWTYDWDAPLEPWRVVDPGGQLDATLTPVYDKVTDLQGAKRSSRVHQVFGRWAGRCTTDDGQTIAFDDLQGFAEEARQHW